MNVLTHLMVGSTTITLYLSYLSWKKRRLKPALWLSFAMLAVSFYSFGYAFEIKQDDIEWIKFWLKVQYLGIPFITPLWLIMIINYLNLETYLNKRLYGLLFIVPAATFILHYTNEFHHLYYSGMYLTKATLMDVAVLTKGPWYWVHIVYSYANIITGLILLYSKLLSAADHMRKQLIVMILGTCIPWVLNLVYLFDVFRNGFDFTPTGFMLSGIIYIYAVFRYQLLRLKQAALERMFESMDDGVILLDNENCIINFNTAACRIFPGLSSVMPEQCRTTEMFQVYPSLLALMNRNESSSCLQYILVNDAQKYFNIRMVLIHDKEVWLGRMLTFSDITEMKKYQERIRSTATQLAALNALKDKLLAVIDDRIRDPVAMLVNLSELLEEELSFAEVDTREMTVEIKEQVRHIFSVVESLLECFRSKTGGTLIVPKAWQLSEVMNLAVGRVQQRAEEKSISIQAAVPERLTIMADKEMLELVIWNLLSNGIKYSEKNSIVRVRAEAKGKMAIVAVQDNGIGIRPERVQLLFQDVQVQPTAGTEGEKGIGLGLFICKELVHRNGGDIWVESNPGEGSTFYVSVPLWVLN